MHYRIFLKNLTPYALVQNVSWYAADQGPPRLIMTKRYGLRNGPNPSGGLGVPPDGKLFVLTGCAPGPDPLFDHMFIWLLDPFELENA